jgi:acyl-CoA reductase-like NAD-dependent aldehyde dehydrogenase
MSDEKTTPTRAPSTGTPAAVTSRTSGASDGPVEQSIDDARAAADRASRETAETLAAMKSAAADAAQRGAAAVADAATKATGTAEESLDDAENIAQESGAWLQARYRENPILVSVLAAAAGVAMLVGLGTFLRGMLRR